MQWQTRLSARNISSRYDSPVGSYAQNADAVNTTISAHGTSANVKIATARPQFPLEL